MNVIGSRPNKWWNNPDKAMVDFVGELRRFAGAKGDRVTVVLDRAPRGADVPSDDLVEVVVARRKGRNAADHEIRVIVGESADPTQWRVVTSDKRLVETVRDLGAKVTSSGTFRAQLDRLQDD